MTTSREQLEQSARRLAQAIDEALNEKRQQGRVGFALFLFDFGEGGNLSYVSNAQRADMVKNVEEWLGRQRAGLVTDAPDGARLERADAWLGEIASHLADNIHRLERADQVVSLVSAFRTVARISREQALREVGAGAPAGARA